MQKMFIAKINCLPDLRVTNFPHLKSVQSAAEVILNKNSGWFDKSLGASFGGPSARLFGISVQKHELGGDTCFISDFILYILTSY